MTEAVTGLDLVELQLRVAAGEPLPISQDEVRSDGHAIEVRLVAEDPAAGWLPSTGTIAHFDLDPEANVRVDTGFRAGSQVTPDYDSLLAKVIAHAPTRVEAATALARGLRRSSIFGIATNRHALLAILDEPGFLAADTTTAYLDEHAGVLEASGAGGDDRLALLLGAVFAADTIERTSDSVTNFAPSGWRNLRTQGERSIWSDEANRSDDNGECPVEVVFCGNADARVLVGAWPEPGEDGVLGVDDRRVVLVRLLDRSPQRQVIEADGRRTVVETHAEPDAVVTISPAGSARWQRQPRFVDHEADAASGGGPICPLPGTVIAVHVEDGQPVTEGTVLMVVEAMKMEHKIVANADAVVSEVRFAVGDRVDQGDLLVALD